MYMHNFPLKMFIMLFSLVLMTQTNTPLYLWVLMEINNIIFLSMVLSSKMNKSSEMPILMLTQFSATSMILISIMLKSPLCTTLGILMKLGIFPFHIWIPMVMNSMPWMIMGVFMTLQKMPPMIFITMSINNKMTTLLVTISPIIMVMKLIKLNNKKMILAASSIIHSSWMIVIAMMSMKLWMIYFIMYSINTWMMIIMMYITPPQMFEYMNTPELVLMKIMSVVNLMGLPPMPFILPKMMMLMMSNPMIFIPLISLLFTTSLSMVFYSRLFSTQILMKTSKTKFQSMKKTMPKMMILWMVIMLSLMIIL